LPKPKAADGAVKGVILRVDAFGNLMTNLTPADLPEQTLKNGAIKMQVADKEIGKLVETFAQGEAGVPVAFLGSSGFIEIAVNKGSAAKQLGAGRGVAVTVATS